MNMANETLKLYMIYPEFEAGPVKEHTIPYFLNPTFQFFGPSV